MASETKTARLLREMRERDELLKSLGRRTGAYSGISKLTKQVYDLTGNPTKDPNRQLRDAPDKRAIDIVRQLTETTTGATGSQIPRAAATPAGTLVQTVGDIGEMVRKARKAMKLNQTDFATHAGVGRRFVSELEGGKSSLEFDKVIACAATAGIDISAKRRQG